VKARAYAAIVAANAIGGVSYLLQKLASQGLPPATMSLLRNAFALACLWIWLRTRGAQLGSWSRADLARVALAGICGYALPLWLGTVGVDLSTSSNGALLILLEPCAILPLSWLLLGSRLTRTDVAAVGLGLVGALCVVLEQSSAADLLAGEHARGNAILFVHAILWGLYTPLTKPLATRRGSLEVTAWAMVFGMLVFVPLAAREVGDWRAGPFLWSSLGWTLVLAIFVSLVSMVLWVESLRFLPAPGIAPFVFLQPIVGALAGWLVLGERPSPAAAVGAALIGAGVLMAILPAWRRRRSGAVAA
jgi:drug/metabolite transporter (DMT)-like permease